MTDAGDLVPRAGVTQAAMAAPFQTTPQNITRHIAAIYAESELDEGQLVRRTYKFRWRALGRSGARCVTTASR